MSPKNIEELKQQAKLSAQQLPPQVFDELREAINCCDTIDEINIIRKLIDDELKIYHEAT